MGRSFAGKFSQLWAEHEGGEEQGGAAGASPVLGRASPRGRGSLLGDAAVSLGEGGPAPPMGAATFTLERRPVGAPETRAPPPRPANRRCLPRGLSQQIRALPSENHTQDGLGGGHSVPRACVKQWRPGRRDS